MKLRIVPLVEDVRTMVQERMDGYKKKIADSQDSIESIKSSALYVDGSNRKIAELEASIEGYSSELDDLSDYMDLLLSHEAPRIMVEIDL